MSAKPQSLAEFAAQQKDRRSVSWMDTLPAEIQEQVIATDTSVAIVLEWLHGLGYTDATDSKIEKWRREKRRARRPD